jgi:pimeloyl-ACP methyl ester carboxylesterase
VLVPNPTRDITVGRKAYWREPSPVPTAVAIAIAALIDSGALGHKEVPVAIIFGETDRYLNPSLAAEIAGLFKDPSFHLVQDASHWPQDDQPEVVAELLKRCENA